MHAAVITVSYNRDLDYLFQFYFLRASQNINALLAIFVIYINLLIIFFL